MQQHGDQDGAGQEQHDVEQPPDEERRQRESDEDDGALRELRGADRHGKAPGPPICLDLGRVAK